VKGCIVHSLLIRLENALVAEVLAIRELNAWGFPTGVSREQENNDPKCNRHAAHLFLLVTTVQTMPYGQLRRKGLRKVYARAKRDVGLAEATFTFLSVIAPIQHS